MSNEISEYNQFCKDLAERYNLSEYVASAIMSEARDFWNAVYELNSKDQTISDLRDMVKYYQEKMPPAYYEKGVDK